MRKIIIYKDWDLIEELKEIYHLEFHQGIEKDKLLRKVINMLENALEISLQA